MLGCSNSVVAYDVDEYPQVLQIDFVPTFSLLMGIPVPYGSLGAVIPELFFGMQRRHITTPGHKDWSFGLLDNFWQLNTAMRTNIFQIRRYLDTYPTLVKRVLIGGEVYTSFHLMVSRYSSISSDLPKSSLRELDAMLKEADALYSELVCIFKLPFDLPRFRKKTGLKQPQYYMV